MWFLQRIINELGGIVTWLGEAAIWAWDSILPLDWLGEVFYELHWYTLNLIRWFWDFDEWLGYAADEIDEILSWIEIRFGIRDWLPNLENIHDWWYNWTTWVGQQIDSWWQSTIATVQGWIDSAVQEFGDLVDNLDTWLSNLQSAWDTFTTSTLPTLADWTGVDDLIRTWFTNFTPFWEGWLDWKDSVAEFFTDPLQWLYTKMDEWFERFW